jgi:acyl-CoA synthetase (AMP-forming)/AMP-acid ligase II
LEAGQAKPHLTAGVPKRIVHLKTTSASTGAARLVAFTAEQLMADATNIVETMGLCAEWPNLGLISLAHSYGFSNLVLPLLLHGIPLVLAGTALPEAVRSAADQFKHVTVAGVPALWRTWFDAGAITPSVRLAISAGAPLPLELEQAVFERYGVKIHNFYGSSECGGIAYDASGSPRSDAACVGAPMRHVDVRIAKDGCVEVRGAAVGEMYWPKPSSNLAGGVFKTSDLGEFRDGRIYLRGRAGDQINVAGRKVLPEAIESALSRHPQVSACLVFGVPAMDAERGEAIVACVAGPAELSAETLKQFAISNLPAWQVPREWWFVDSIESNHRGKLSRAEWRKRFLESRPARCLFP